jgi:hypothetical protein
MAPSISEYGLLVTQSTTSDIFFFFKRRRMLHLVVSAATLAPSLAPESFKGPVIHSNDFTHKSYQIDKPAINLFLLRVWLEGSASFSTRWPPLVGSRSIYTRLWVHDCAEDTKDDDDDLEIYSLSRRVSKMASEVADTIPTRGFDTGGLQRRCQMRFHGYSIRKMLTWWASRA